MGVRSVRGPDESSDPAAGPSPPRRVYKCSRRLEDFASLIGPRGPSQRRRAGRLIEIAAASPEEAAAAFLKRFNGHLSGTDGREIIFVLGPPLSSSSSLLLLSPTPQGPLMVEVDWRRRGEFQAKAASRPVPPRSSVETATLSDSLRSIDDEL